MGCQKWEAAFVYSPFSLELLKRRRGRAVTYQKTRLIDYPCANLHAADWVDGCCSEGIGNVGVAHRFRVEGTKFVGVVLDRDP
jgi:hypothetical protein